MSSELHRKGKKRIPGVGGKLCSSMALAASDMEKWPEFRRRYLEELKNNDAAVKELIAKLGTGNATLLLGSRKLNRNNAVVLKEYLETFR
ncbi:MAG: DUF488 family protein [Nitrosospira sp.]